MYAACAEYLYSHGLMLESLLSGLRIGRDTPSQRKASHAFHSKPGSSRLALGRNRRMWPGSHDPATRIYVTTFPGEWPIL